MSERLPRRTFLRTTGGVSLAVLLAACTRGGSGATDVTTTDGSTATVDALDGPTTIDVASFDAGSSCTLTPELTEGPYYFEVDAIRRDLREDREGTALRLGLRVRDAATCAALPSAVVDVWHCDADGTYSGFESASQGADAAAAPVASVSTRPSGPPPGGAGGPGGGGGEATRSDDETYLRGAQTTDTDGIAEFLTIFPGWYRGRTVHVHVKVHLDATTVLTTQLFFDEGDLATVYADAPYAARAAERDTTNDTDGIFSADTIVDVGRDDEGNVLALLTLDVASA